jgi:hypothetical protein
MDRFDSKDEGSLRAANSLRTDERKFAAWPKNVREHYAGKHESKRHTDKNKSKAVVAVLEISSFVGVGEQRHYPLLIGSTQYPPLVPAVVVSSNFEVKIPAQSNFYFCAFRE